MFPSSGATIRADIHQVVTEAAAVDGWFIGDQVMPPLMVPAKSGTYAKVTTAKGALLDAVATPRERGGSYGLISRIWESDTYDCLDYGLEEAVDDTDAKDLGRYFNAEATAAKLTYRNLRLAYEARVAAAVFNTTNFGSATNSAVAYTAANKATISFVDDVIAAIEAVANAGTQADTIVLNSTVMARISTATLVQAYVRGSLDGNIKVPVNAANLAAAFADFGIKRVLVGRARYNTGKKGAAKSISSTWSSTYVWVGSTNPGAKRPEDGGAGFTLAWSEDGSGLFTTETYRDEKTRSNMVRVRQNVAEKVTDGTAGVLIGTQYS